MAILKTDYAKGVRPMPIAKGSEVVSVRMVLVLAAALAAADVIEFGFLPEDHVPVDYFIDNDDLDTNVGPTLAADFGLLTAAGTAVSAAAADGGAKWLAASTTLQGAALTRPAGVAHTRVTPSSTGRRKVGMVITTGPATGVAAGNIGVTFLYRAANQGG